VAEENSRNVIREANIKISEGAVKRTHDTEVLALEKKAKLVRDSKTEQYRKLLLEATLHEISEFTTIPIENGQVKISFKPRGEMIIPKVLIIPYNIIPKLIYQIRQHVELTHGMLTLFRLICFHELEKIRFLGLTTSDKSDCYDHGGRTIVSLTSISNPYKPFISISFEGKGISFPVRNIFGFVKVLCRTYVFGKNNVNALEAALIQALDRE
jgi:hypothetical protein